MKRKNIEEKLAFVITTHQYLGVIIDAYIVELTKSGDFSLSTRKVTGNTLPDYNIIHDDSTIKIIETIDEYNDDIIVKSFSKKKLKPLDFFGNLKDDEFKKIIRPYIEKRINICLNLIKDNNIPIYFQGKKKDPLTETPVKILDSPGAVAFNFVKNNDSTEYSISVKQDNNQINLKNSNAYFLTEQPCWLYINNTLLWFKDNVDSKKLKPFLTKDKIIIPSSYEEKYYNSFIKNAVKNYRVKTEGFKVERKYPECKPELKIETKLLGTPSLMLLFKYGNIIFRSNDPNPSYVKLIKNKEEYLFEKTFRKEENEQKIEEHLISLGLKNIDGALYSINEVIKGDDKKYYTDKKHRLLEWLNSNEENLKNIGISIEQDSQEKTKYFTGKINLNLELEDKNDWFDLHGMVQFGQIKIPFTRLKNHIVNGIREFELPNGEKAIIPEEWFTKYSDVLKFSKNESDKYQFDKHHFNLINKLEKNDKGTVKKLNNLKDPSKFKGHPVPGSIKAELRPYQIEGYNWLTFLRENDLNGCLADDMGLGKTIQTLTALVNAKIQKNGDTNISNSKINGDMSLFTEEEMYPRHTSLIVMPLSLVHNWENEIYKFTPQLKVFNHTGIKRVQDCREFRKYDIILTTYGVIRNDIKFMKKFEFFYLILDESQVIKNPSSKIFKSIKKVNAKHKLTLTGTPIENSLADLWSQMTFLNEGLLGSLNFFKDYFQSPIEKQNDADKQEELQELIRPFILRRSKSKVAKDLPELSVHTYYCEMEEDQKKIYEEQKSAIRNLILENIEKKGKDKSQFVILNGLMQLRLLANHPSIAEKKYQAGSGKFNEIMRSVIKLIMEGHNVLIFSSFVKHLNLIKESLEELNFKYSLLTGETANKKRQEQVTKFQKEEDTRVFLISLKAGGVGLNLTSADYVFIIDPWWNPAAENQAINRTHRIGQTKNVFAYKFITRDSIEEKILKLQNKKLHLANELVNNNNPFKEFTEEEIKDLFN